MKTNRIIPAILFILTIAMVANVTTSDARKVNSEPIVSSIKANASASLDHVNVHEILTHLWWHADFIKVTSTASYPDKDCGGWFPSGDQVCRYCVCGSGICGECRACPYCAPQLKDSHTEPDEEFEQNLLRMKVM